MVRTSATLVKSPTFNISMLDNVVTSRRQLGKSDDAANTTLVYVSRIVKTSNHENSNTDNLRWKLLKFLNNNVTGALEWGTSLWLTFGDGSGVVLDQESGRFTRAE